LGERGNAAWKGKNAAKGRRDQIHRLHAFAINAFTPAARSDSFAHNFLVCDLNSVILDSLEILKSLVSKGSGFTGFGLSVGKIWAEKCRLPKLDWIVEHYFVG